MFTVEQTKQSPEHKRRATSDQVPATSDERRATSDEYMPNKPNFKNAQKAVTPSITSNYDNFHPLDHPKNKPNSNPIKPNQSQFQPKKWPTKPKTNPIQTQFLPL